MGLYEHWPYTNLHELNLDWILVKMKELAAEWVETRAGLDATTEELEENFADLKDYVMNYFENTDFRQMVSDKLDQMYKDGDLFTLFDRFVPYLTPRMYGADEKAADNSSFFAAMFNDAVTTHKPIFMDGEGYNFTSPVTVSGPVTVIGNGSNLMFAAGINGIVFDTDAHDSYIENLKISSLSGFYPVDSTAALTIGGAHMVLDGIVTTGFGTGIHIIDTLSDGNQTGTVIKNCHCRYCRIGFDIGALSNNKTTDFYISDCTAAASEKGFYIGSCIGYKINNIHVWGDYNDAGPVNAFDCHDTSLTSFNNIYTEPTTGASFLIHTRKGVNFSNISARVGNTTPEVFSIEGSTSGWEVNANNIIVRDTNPTIGMLFYLRNSGTLKISNYQLTDDSEQFILYHGAGTVYLDGIRKYANAFAAQTSAGDLITTGTVQKNISSSVLTDTVSFDLSTFKKSTGYIFQISTVTRSNDNIVYGGCYQVVLYSTYNAGIKVPLENSGVIVIANDPRLTVTAAVNSDNNYQLDITIAKTAGITLSYIVQPLGIITA